MPQFLSAVHLHLDASQAFSLQQASFLQVLPCGHCWAAAFPQFCLQSFLQQVQLSFVQPAWHLAPCGHAQATFLQAVSQTAHFLASGIADSIAATRLRSRSHLLGCIPVCRRRIVVARLASHKTQSGQSQYKNQFSHCVMVLIWSLISSMLKAILCARTPLQIIATCQKP